MKTTPEMNDAQRKQAWATVTDPTEALEELVAHWEYLGPDLYYRDLDGALRGMAVRALGGPE